MVLNEVIRSIVAAQIALVRPVTEIADADDLYGLGLTSHGAVQVMLAVEDRFGIEFPDSLVTRATFGSIDSLVAAVRSLTGDA